jgi:hypothetical protein
MIDPDQIKLIPEDQQKPEQVFTELEKYEEFCRKFAEEVGPDLEKQREARQQSEAEAKQRWMK